ncbi:MAG TPA: hypothetical protein DCR63_05770 [Microbacterium sp.]|nr:hypothetical protein [Microbacterium sp.]
MSASRDNELPEGVIDADPVGGWESGETADGESAERNAAAIDSPGLSDSGLPRNTSDGTDATADGRQRPAAPAAPDAPIEGAEAGQSADPDLSADEDES